MHFILQKKDAEDGDYIVRARGAWFGNRSISAEVDIEAGVYEVVPKIVAKRDAEAPDVHEVVTKVAERNPQKLRQIGLNHDLANAKGTAGPSEEKKKKRHEARRREAAEKGKRNKEAADKNKAAFEIWKKEEKAEYEAWKKEKRQMQEQTRLEKRTPGAADAFTHTLGAGGAFTSVAEDQTTKPTEPIIDNSVTDVASHAAPGVAQSPPATATSEAESMCEAAGLDLDESASLSDDAKVENSPYGGIGDQRRASSRAGSRRRRRSPHMYYNPPHNFYGAMPRQEADSGTRSPMDHSIKPWNAVCVLGLRVHSKDPEVSIKLVQPKNAEECALLDVGGETAAEATM